jgi:DNA-binding CsgD family transcriptional regulator
MQKRRRVERIYRLHVERDRQKIARLLFQGLSTAKIAKQLKCSSDTVRDLLHSPEFRRSMASMSASSST